MYVLTRKVEGTLLRGDRNTPFVSDLSYKTLLYKVKKLSQVLPEL